MSSDTSPDNVTQTLNFAFSPAVGPGGTMFVSVGITMGIASFTFGVPVETALDWLNSFNESFRACQRDARKLATGLTLPKDDTPQGLILPNGSANGVH